MRFLDLIVEVDREDHIARHGVTFDEVRDVVLGGIVMERTGGADKAMAKVTSKTNEASEQKASRIPTFRTIEEEAEFWDTHDSAEFEDELEEVTDLAFGSIQSKDQLVLRIMGEDFTALVERAQEQGVSPAALVRGWIQERLGTASPVDTHNAHS